MTTVTLEEVLDLSHNVYIARYNGMSLSEAIIEKYRNEFKSDERFVDFDNYEHEEKVRKIASLFVSDIFKFLQEG